MNKILIEPPRKPELFNTSKEYWENRYQAGGNSGSGSYNRLADFKAEVINEFIEKNNIQSCIEWGCGDGNQLNLINYKEYLGLDISSHIIELNKNRFNKDCTKKFRVINEDIKIDKRYDMAISLDVIYHLVEDDIYETYMKNLFSYSKKYVCIYASNIDSPQCGYYNHMKHRKFTEYIEKNFRDWCLYKYVENKYPFDENNSANTSFSDFYFFKRDNLIKRMFKYINKSKR